MRCSADFGWRLYGNTEPIVMYSAFAVEKGPLPEAYFSLWIFWQHLMKSAGGVMQRSSRPFKYGSMGSKVKTKFQEKAVAMSTESIHHVKASSLVAWPAPPGMQMF